MSTQIQYRGGTAEEHASFTGALREITVDTTNKTLRVHDGVTVGGTRLARLDEVGEQVFSLNDQVVAESYVVPTGKNALAVGSVAVANNVAVTISENSILVIL